MIFPNTIYAYNYLEDYLEKGGTRNICSTYRSKKFKKDKIVCESIGMRWEVVDTSDVMDLIKFIDPEGYYDRLNMLDKLSREFVFNGYIIREKEYYTYNNRIMDNKRHIIASLKEMDESNRQAYLPIYTSVDSHFIGEKEIPCSLGYHFFKRNNKLDMVYYMRSLDLNIWPNDVILSRCVQRHIATEAEIKEIGRIIFMVGSLHIFKERE